MNQSEIDLLDILNTLWKRKWHIIIPTLFFVIATGVYSFLVPPIWEIDTIILPSRILVQTADRKLEEFTFDTPEQISSKINQDSYNTSIVNELNLDIRSFPKLKAENLRDTNLVRVSLRDKNVERAKSILNSLINLLKKDLDLRSDTEKMTIEEEIRAANKTLVIVQQRTKEIEKEKNDTKKRIELLETEQSKSLKKQNRSETESLAMLLYSNEIQQSLRDYTELTEKLGKEKIEEENISLEIARKTENLKRIESTQVVKEPTSSLSPVSPKKKLNVMIAGILSLAIFTMFALIMENLERQKNK